MVYKDMRYFTYCCTWDIRVCMGILLYMDILDIRTAIHRHTVIHGHTRHTAIHGHTVLLYVDILDILLYMEILMDKPDILLYMGIPLYVDILDILLYMEIRLHMDINPQLYMDMQLQSKLGC